MRPHLNTLNLRFTKRIRQASNQFTPRNTASSLLRNQTASGDPIGAAGVFSRPTPFKSVGMGFTTKEEETDELLEFVALLLDRLTKLLIGALLWSLVLLTCIHGPDVYREMSKHFAENPY